MPLLMGTRRALLGGGAFDPRALGNLSLWLDATKHNAADGDAVTTWADLSGNGKDATQATAGKKPTYKTAIQNGKPVIRFDGGDGLAVPAIDLTGTPAVSLYMVASSSAATDQVLFEFSDNKNSYTDAFLMYVLATSKVLEMGGTGDVGSANFRTTAVASAAMKVMTGVFDKSAGAGFEAFAWVNGDGAGTKPTTFNNTNALGNRASYIGARNQASLFLTGDIAEVLLYRVAHTTAERQAVEGYLRQKWGTS